MRTFVLILFALGLKAPALAAVVPRAEEKNGGLEVEFSHLVGSSIKAAMTNIGSESLKLLDYDTLLDKNAVHKLSIVKDGEEVAFRGLDAQYKGSNLPEEAFTTLAPDETFESIINIAGLHDVQGGDYVISAMGAIPYAAGDGTKIVGSVPYASNELSLTIDPRDVELVPNAVPMLGKRVIAADCTGDQGIAFAAAKGRLSDAAKQAASAAREGDETLFEKFFKTQDPAIRAAVGARLEAVSSEAAQVDGLTTYYCQDPNGYCDSQALAYTLPSQNVIANCDLFYELPELSSACGAQDQTTTVMHQLLHAPAVLQPPTQDLAFGYVASLSLDAQAAFLNSDNYVFYVNAVLNDCI